MGTLPNSNVSFYNPVTLPMRTSSATETVSGLQRRPDFPTFVSRFLIAREIIKAPDTLSRPLQIALNSRKQTLSHEERLANTERQALTLFTRYRDKPLELLNDLHEKLGVVIMKGDEYPWVEEILKNSNIDAMYSSSTYPYYAGQRQIGGFQMPAPSDQSAGAEYLRFLFDMQQNGKTVILIRANKARKDEIFHETFHMLQDMNGLPFHAPTLDLQLKTNEFAFGGLTFWTGLNHAFKFFWLNTLKALGMVHERPDGAGAAVRNLEQREMETIRFIRKNRKALGLSRYDSWKDWLRLLTYKNLYKQSLILDYEEQKAARKSA